MEAPRINTVSPATVAAVGPREGPSPRVRSALEQIGADVRVMRTMRQLRLVYRDRDPDLVIFEVPELSAERLTAEVDLLRGSLEPGERSRWVQEWRSPSTAPLAVRMRIRRGAASDGVARTDTLLLLVGERG